MSSRLPASALLVLLTPLTALAQSDVPADATLLPGVEIRGDAVQNSVERAIRARRDAPDSRVVIERQELTQFNDLPIGDVLRRLPSAVFDGGNRARELNLRGAGREYTQILINGRRLLDGASARTIQLDRLPAAMVERVEFLRSPMADRDAQGAAGTLNIVLRNDIQTPITELGIGAGLYEQQGAIGDINLLHANRAGRLSYTLLGSLQSPARSEDADVLAYSGTGAANGGSLNSNRRRYGQVSLLPSFRLDLGATNVVLEPSYLFTRENRLDIKDELLTNQSAVRRQEREDRTRFRESYGSRVAVTHDFGAFSTTAALDAQQGREDTRRKAERYTSSGLIDRLRRRTEDVDFTRVAPSFRVDSPLPGHRLSFGLGHVAETRDEDNSDMQDGVPLAANAARVFAVREGISHAFVQDGIGIGPDGLLTLGMRFESSTTRTRDAAGLSTTTELDVPLPSANYRHRLGEATDLRLGVGRTLRRPDLRELSPTVTSDLGTTARPDTAGNANLRPERIWGADVGIDHAIYGGRGLLAANLFGRSVQDRIEQQVNFEAGRAVSRPTNVADGSFWGVEFEGRMPLDLLGRPEFSLWGNLALLDSQVDDPRLGRERRFADQPPVVGTVGLDWFVEPIATTFGVAANWRASTDVRVGQAAGASLRTERSEALRLDFSASIAVTEAITVSVSALNLLGEDEKVRATSYNASGNATAISIDREPTWRTLYVATRIRF
ncbi:MULTISPECIES: TonB-dependent receptor plug domain-containing protein [Roseomonadaceae]|uniref:TonB-dependent receptor n=1 Tax=Falsiroseomonas oleicola TaxID=2801474 RepID=A0ABS6H7T0_9PROT|nr:TonB-dependent receptor [Roseomonas oleicola]MBU8544758.1 TonB-dependent receptor [Roseomonas oleicola]